MCNAHKHHRVYKGCLCTTERCVLVHSIVGGFGRVGLLWHCWEGLVVDRLPTVDYWLGSKVDCFWLALVGYWGMAGWDGFVVQTPIPTEQVEPGRGIELLTLVVHSIFGWVAVPQMWAFALRIAVLANPRPESATVA